MLLLLLVLELVFELELEFELEYDSILSTRFSPKQIVHITFFSLILNIFGSYISNNQYQNIKEVPFNKFLIKKTFHNHTNPLPFISVLKTEKKYPFKKDINIIHKSLNILPQAQHLIPSFLRRASFEYLYNNKEKE